MKIKGSSVIIAAMYITWIAFIAAQVWIRITTQSWLPAEMTYGTASLFIVETVSLARLKMAKEGGNPGPKKSNTFLSRLGADVPDFEEEAQKAAKHAADKEQQ